jgi:hypothetical protein
MADDIATAVAAACRALPGWPNLTAPTGYPDGLALCIVDSIWSMGVRYGAVENVLREYRTWLDPRQRSLADRRSATELVTDIETAGGPAAFADLVKNHGRTSTRNGVLKSEAVYEAAIALSRLGVTTTSRLREVFAEPEVEEAWRRVHGQRSGISWHYLRILAGIEDIKADRMICRFVATASGQSAVAPAAAYRAMHDAYDIPRAENPALTLRAIDNAAWQSQRRR